MYAGNRVTQKFFCFHQVAQVGFAVIITDFIFQSIINR